MAAPEEDPRTWLLAHLGAIERDLVAVLVQHTAVRDQAAAAFARRVALQATASVLLRLMRDVTGEGARGHDLCQQVVESLRDALDTFHAAPPTRPH